MSRAYKRAGVDVEAGYEAVNLMKKHIERTHTPGVLSPVGGFGGLFKPDITGIAEPILVSGTDGVGTKLKIAFLMDKHDTVGQDCVAMCVNDIVCSGAKPLFFLDYIAVGKNVPEKMAKIVSGIADGCVMAGCALIGGETAEMPGFYSENEYDLAGFAVGMADRSKIIDGSGIKQGDVLVGIASSGLHSNGFSLVRNAFKISNSGSKKLEEYIETLGKTLGEELLTPTKIYAKGMGRLMEGVVVKAAGHITGGGFIENVPRMLPKGFSTVIKKDSYPVLPIFELLRSTGNLEDEDLYNTFNMGIGMIVAVAPEEGDAAVKILNEAGERAYIIGEIKKGEGEVLLV